MKPSDTTTAQAPEVPAAPHEFAMQFTSTPRGARLARRLVSHRLDQWGHPYDSPVNETLTLIAAELTSNAVRHGHVPGRDFHLRLTAAPEALRIEVTDTRTEQVPPASVHEAPGDAESGRGLLLVARLATRWGTNPRPSAPGKTVWAELSPAAACPTARISAPASPDVRSGG
ncbi:ATP-binding protein [Streptomyces lancefieldiae]